MRGSVEEDTAGGGAEEEGRVRAMQLEVESLVVVFHGFEEGPQLAQAAIITRFSYCDGHFGRWAPYAYMAMGTICMHGGLAHQIPHQITHVVTVAGLMKHSVGLPNLSTPFVLLIHPAHSHGLAP